MPYIKNLNLEFENLPVKLVTIKRIPSIETPGINIREMEKDNEFIVELWLAFELIEMGFARLVEEGISREQWTQIHYKERFQPLGQPTSLPESFYSKAHLSFMREDGKIVRNGREENIGRLKGRFRDVLESRIGKITRLASAEVEVDTRALQPEEASLYKALHDTIDTWRKSMKRVGEN
jgi:hypothetical protein